MTNNRVLLCVNEFIYNTPHKIKINILTLSIMFKIITYYEGLKLNKDSGFVCVGK